MSVECLWGPFLPPHCICPSFPLLFLLWPGVRIPFSFPFLWNSQSDLSSGLCACHVALGEFATFYPTSFSSWEAL